MKKAKFWSLNFDKFTLVHAEQNNKIKSGVTMIWKLTEINMRHRQWMRRRKKHEERLEGGAGMKAMRGITKW